MLFLQGIGYNQLRRLFVVIPFPGDALHLGLDAAEEVVRPERAIEIHHVLVCNPLEQEAGKKTMTFVLGMKHPVLKGRPPGMRLH